MTNNLRINHFIWSIIKNNTEADRLSQHFLCLFFFFLIDFKHWDDIAVKLLWKCIAVSYYSNELSFRTQMEKFEMICMPHIFLNISGRITMQYAIIMFIHLMIQPFCWIYHIYSCFEYWIYNSIRNIDSNAVTFFCHQVSILDITIDSHRTV